MSRILIVYASTDGQTRRIARHVADRLADAGHGVELMPAAEDDDLAIGRFDGVVLAGSVHLGGYQKALSEFAAEKAALLDGVPTLFLSVSLSAAGHESEDWAGLEKIETAFREATGWTPGQVVRVAGAYLPSRYDVFRAWAMRRILAERDPGADPDADKEYTDWPGLDAAVDGWVAGL
jgi:menaquinone-dependent protoporphyrinogen oxidase